MGISLAFGGGAMAQGTFIAVTAQGLAEALGMAAWSLFLGVVATWSHRYLSSKVEAFDIEIENESVKLVNSLVLHLERRNSMPDVPRP